MFIYDTNFLSVVESVEDPPISLQQFMSEEKKEGQRNSLVGILGSAATFFSENFTASTRSHKFQRATENRELGGDYHGEN